MSFVNFLYPRGFYIDEISDDYIKIVIPYLEKGYGITIGNALRRILLSSIEGYAVVGVYIEGIVHEFSSIDGVLEDVPYILLNIKKVRFKVDENLITFPARVSINFQGPGEIRADAIETYSGIDILNKDQYIATVTTKRDLKIDIYIEKGIGFVPKEEYPENYRDLFSFGTIFVDGNFSPVEKVNWSVEKMIYEAYMDKDKLTLEIWTNGTVNPLNIYKRTLEILEKHVLLLKNELRKQEEFEYTTIEEFSKKIELVKSKPITDLPLSPKVLELLKSKKIETIGELITYAEEEIGDWFNEAGLPQRDFEDLRNKVYSLSLKFSSKARS